MSADPNKKSARAFQCRDVLWEAFEHMARELECSVDYLINESMKHYARQRSYSQRTPFPGPVRVDGPASPQPPTSQAPGQSAMPLLPASAPQAPVLGQPAAPLALHLAVASTAVSPSTSSVGASPPPPAFASPAAAPGGAQVSASTGSLPASFAPQSPAFGPQLPAPLGAPAAPALPVRPVFSPPVPPPLVSCTEKAHSATPTAVHD